MLKTIHVIAEAPVIDPTSPKGRRAEDREGEPTAVGLVNGVAKAANRVTNQNFEALHGLSDPESKALPYCRSANLFSYPGASAGQRPIAVCWTWRVFRMDSEPTPRLLESMNRQYVKLFESVAANDTEAQAKALIDGSSHTVTLAGRAGADIPGNVSAPRAMLRQAAEFTELGLPAALFCTTSRTVVVSEDEADAMLSSRSINTIQIRHSKVTVTVAKQAIEGVFPAYKATYQDGSYSLLGWKRGDNKSELVLLHISSSGEILRASKDDPFYRGRQLERQAASGQHGFVIDHVNELNRPEVVSGDASGMQASLEFIDSARRLLNGWQTVWPPAKVSVRDRLESAISRFNL